tara:strand:- start:553 stop:1005 length:453 start_codon:yes stop_codon:yes gene_type:complete
MGTRSLTRIIPRQEGLSFNEGHTLQELSHVNMYRHLDGYPEGHGLELAEFLKDVEIVRGVPLVNKTRYMANGSGCLAAQMVKYFKDGVGDIYLHPHDEDGGWEDYIYTIYPKENEPCYIAIYEVYNKKCIFVGTALDLIKKYKTNTNEKG